MFVVIGCPVFQRDWILPDWFDAILSQDFPLEDLGFTFEVSPDDEPTIAELLRFAEDHPQIRWFDISVNAVEKHVHHPEGHRYWDSNRYQMMARMRNNLMDRVTCRDPDRYFSLDSDILLEDPTTISQLVELTSDHDAVAPLLYMTPDDVGYPNIMSWVPGMSNHRAQRRNDYPIGTLFQQDVIMAAVMMSKRVFSETRYQYHRQGEDLGWSLDCKAKGFKLYSASYIYTAHIMSRAMLEGYKVNGDPRKDVKHTEVV